MRIHHETEGMIDKLYDAQYQFHETEGIVRPFRLGNTDASRGITPVVILFGLLHTNAYGNDKSR